MSGVPIMHIVTSSTVYARKEVYPRKTVGQKQDVPGVFGAQLRYKNVTQTRLIYTRVTHT